LDATYATQLKIGVLGGSVLCGVLGTLLLVRAYPGVRATAVSQTAKP
jgi:translation initiation factor 2 gamma subunit (eIF-2gamma)